MNRLRFLLLAAALAAPTFVAAPAAAQETTARTALPTVLTAE